jgi:PEP-CTERM motif
MKLRATLLLLAPCAAVAGDFINLGFEDPNLTHAQAHQDGEVGPTSEVLQGWSLTAPSGTVVPAQTIIIPFSGGPLSLTPAPIVPASGVDFGKYSLFLGAVGNSLTPVYNLEQSGMIPQKAVGLTFCLYSGSLGRSPSDNFSISINGHPLVYSESIFTHIGVADVSAYAGQDVDLKFTFGNNSFHAFDIAGFTTTPEPSTYALFGLGAVLLWWQSRRKAD